MVYICADCGCLFGLRLRRRVLAQVVVPVAAEVKLRRHRYLSLLNTCDIVCKYLVADYHRLNQPLPLHGYTTKEKKTKYSRRGASTTPLYVGAVKFMELRECLFAFDVVNDFTSSILRFNGDNNLPPRDFPHKFQLVGLIFCCLQC